MLIERTGSQTLPVTVGTSLSNSSAVDRRSWAGGSYIPANGMTAMAFYGGHSESGPFVPLYNGESTDTAITQTIGGNGRGYNLPEQLYGWPFFKMVATGAAGTITVSLQS